MAIKISQMPPAEFTEVVDEGYVPVAITDTDTYKVPLKDLPFPKNDWEITVADKKLTLWSK